MTKLQPWAQKIIRHRLRCWPPQFEAMKRGEKLFDLRRDDRNFQVGDILIQEEYTPDNGYTGDICCFVVTYKLIDFAGIEPGFCIMGCHPFELPPSEEISVIHGYDSPGV